MFMAAKLSDLVDETSGANLQMEGHVDVLTQGTKDLWEPEALDRPLAVLFPCLQAAIQLP